MKSSSQIPKDGYGQEKTLYGHAMRLKAKDLTTTRSTTLKITGMTSGAVHYIDVLVRNGEPARFSPPATTPKTVPKTTGRTETTFKPPGGPPPGGPGGPPPGGRGGREEERGGRDEGRQGREEGRDGREEEKGTTR